MPFKISTGGDADFHIHSIGDKAGLPADAPTATTYAVKANPQVLDPTFLKYLFQHAHMSGKFAPQVHGTTVQHLTTKDAHRIMLGHIQSLYGKKQSLEKAERPPGLQELIARASRLRARASEIASTTSASTWKSRHGGHVIVSPDTRKPGGWRATMITEEGEPSGHTEADSHEEALKLAHSCGADIHGEPVQVLKKCEDLEEPADLAKGERGDWKSEGYEISHEVSKAGKLPHIVVRASLGGKPVGELEAGGSSARPGAIFPVMVQVHKEHRRKGLATAMYQHAEQTLGSKFVPSHMQSRDAKKLWAQKGRPFGKAEKEILMKNDSGKLTPPQWMGHPIVHPDHVQDLETRAAINEFHHKMPRAQAEQAAHDSYVKEQRERAAAHHLTGMKAAMATGNHEDARKHWALYDLHLKGLGKDSVGSVPPEIEKRMMDENGAKPLYRFKAHKGDLYALHEPSKDQAPPQGEPIQKAEDLAKGDVIQFPGKKARKKIADMGRGAPEQQTLNPEYWEVCSHGKAFPKGEKHLSLCPGCKQDLQPKGVTDLGAYRQSKKAKPDTKKGEIPMQPVAKAEAKRCKWRLGERRCNRQITHESGYCHDHVDHWANKIKQKEPKDKTEEDPAPAPLEKAVAARPLNLPKDGTPERADYDKRYDKAVHEHFAHHTQNTIDRAKVKISEVTGGTNAAVQPARLAEYEGLARAGQRVPPIVVRRDDKGTGWYVVDGNHRVEAARRAGVPELDAWAMTDLFPGKTMYSMDRDMKNYRQRGMNEEQIAADLRTDGRFDGYFGHDQSNPRKAVFLKSVIEKAEDAPLLLALTKLVTKLVT